MILRRIYIILLLSLALQPSLFSKEKEKSESSIASIYYNDGDIWLDIPDSLLGKELIFYSKVISSSNVRETNVGYYPQKQLLVKFTKVDSTLILSQLNDFVVVPEYDSLISKSVENSRASSVIFKAPIKRVDGVNKSKFTEFFKGDKKYLLAKDNMAYNRLQGYVVRDYDYKSDKSYIKGITATNSSISVISELTYSVTKKLFAITKVGNPKPVTATVASTFYLPKESNYISLESDKRVGVGEVSMLEYSSTRQGSKRISYATRLNANNKKTPILTLYRDSIMQDVVVEALDRAAKMWNEGFKTIGYSNAIVIKKQCKELDINKNFAATVRYLITPDNLIRSNVIANPRSGEILSADIVVPQGILDEVKKEILLIAAHGVPQAQTLNMPDSILVGPLATKLAYHIGRCLGFIDNDSASGFVPTDSLKSVSYTANNGISNSVMDEFKLNYIASSKDIANGVKWYQHKLGKFDISALEFLYGEQKNNMGDSTLYFFGNSKSSPTYADPRALKNDLGDNPIKSATYALENLYSTIESIGSWLELDDSDYLVRMSLIDYSVEEFFKYVTPVLQNIGGVYIYNNEGDESSKYKIVDRETQIASLEFLLELTDGCKAMDTDKFIKYADLNSNISEFISKELFSTTLTKVCKLSQKFENNLPRVDGLEIISNYLWVESLKGKHITNSTKRMQLIYVNKLLELSNKTDYDSNSIYNLLIETKKIIEKSKQKANVNNVGHYGYLQLLMKNYLNEN